MAYLDEVVEKTVEHYAVLAMTPGWYDYARHQVAHMIKDCPALWADLGVRVKKRIEEKKIESGVGLPAGGAVPQPQERQALGGDARNQEDLSRSVRVADSGAKTQAQLELTRRGD